MAGDGYLCHYFSFFVNTLAAYQATPTASPMLSESVSMEKYLRANSSVRCFLNIRPLFCSQVLDLPGFSRAILSFSAFFRSGLPMALCHVMGGTSTTCAPFCMRTPMTAP